MAIRSVTNQISALRISNIQVKLKLKVPVGQFKERQELSHHIYCAQTKVKWGGHGPSTPPPPHQGPHSYTIEQRVSSHYLNGFNHISYGMVL